MRAVLIALLFVPVVAADHTGPMPWDPAYQEFPTHDEVLTQVKAAMEHDWITGHLVGKSETGREIWALEITNPAGEVPVADRVITFLMTQQHGNEPAGTPAALQLLDDIVSGNAGPWLDNQILLLLPMANPDGGLANTRANDNGVDINRDHVALRTTEGQAIHAVLNKWDVHIAIDHHEYSGTGVGYPVPVRSYDYDLTTIHPTHGNVREPTMTASEDMMFNYVWPKATAAGYTVGTYGVTSTAGFNAATTAGGPDPGILRNSFGLNNVVGMLAESFVNAGNPLITEERRTEVHYLTMQAVLEYGSQNAPDVIAAKRESERLNREEPMEEYLEVYANWDNRGPLARAYALDPEEPDDAVVLGQLFALHGLPAPVDGAAGTTVNLDHGRSMLAAAIVHPASTRAVVPAAAAEIVAPQDACHIDYRRDGCPEDEATASEDEPVPLPLSILLVGLAAALLRRPRQGT